VADISVTKRSLMGRLVAAGAPDDHRLTRRTRVARIHVPEVVSVMSQTIQMIPVAKPVLDEQEVEAVRRVILSGWVTQGPRVAAFDPRSRSSPSPRPRARPRARSRTASRAA